jgi:glucan phosphoethanolaminetransferase (alkaline phosphatase superfamily)
MDKYTTMGICDIMFIVFLILKLAGLIDWSWWWVISPVLIPMGIYTLFIFFLLIFKFTYHFVTSRKNKNQDTDENNKEEI